MPVLWFQPLSTASNRADLTGLWAGEISSKQALLLSQQGAPFSLEHAEKGGSLKPSHSSFVCMSYLSKRAEVKDEGTSRLCSMMSELCMSQKRIHPSLLLRIVICLQHIQVMAG